MTGYGSDQIRDQAGELGVNDYVEKPFEVGTLMHIVRDLLREGETESRG
jgi:DNA-binding response OmpR family regulator